MLKVLTNYLCTVHLVALAEALAVAKVVGLDMNTTYEGIRISSGNSFVHETESQVILNGSRDIGFTMDLVIKDVGLFDTLARDHDVPLEMSPLVVGSSRTASTVTARASTHRTSSSVSRKPAASRCSAPDFPRRSWTTCRNPPAMKWCRRDASGKSLSGCHSGTRGARWRAGLPSRVHGVRNRVRRRSASPACSRDPRARRSAR